MKHKNIENLIQKQLDREITPEESEVLQEHLSSCPDCRSVCRQHLSAEKEIVSMVEIFPRHDFNQRVLRQLGLTKQLSWHRFIPVAAGAWFAASLGVCAILTVLFGRTVLAKIVTGIPDVIRLVGKVRVVADALGHVLIPFLRLAPNPFYLPVALVFGLFMFFFFSRVVPKPKPVPLIN